MAEKKRKKKKNEHRQNYIASPKGIANNDRNHDDDDNKNHNTSNNHRTVLSKAYTSVTPHTSTFGYWALAEVCTLRMDDFQNVMEVSLSQDIFLVKFL